MNELQTRIRSSDSLWRSNPALVHLFGLSPLLAVADSIASGLALGLMTLLILCLSAMTCSLLRLTADKPWRFIVFLLITATMTTGLSWLTSRFFTGLYAALNIYIVLLCSNFIVLLSFDEFSQAAAPRLALIRALRLGGGYLLACCLFGALREVIFAGRLLTDWRILLPDNSVQLANDMLPAAIDRTPGETLPFIFILLGLLLALRNFVQQLLDSRRSGHAPPAPTIQRARVTGRLHKQASSDTDIKIDSEIDSQTTEEPSPP